MKHEQLEPNSNLPARKPRHDGWTVERQEAFLKALACCGCITDAAAAVGMSRQSAHNLYNHPRAEGFRRAFDAALDSAIPLRVEAGAWERAVKGVPRPIFYKGEQIGEYRHFDERLTMFLLRFRRRHRFGPEADGLPRPPADIPGVDPAGFVPFDPENELEGCLEILDFEPEPELEPAPDSEQAEPRQQ